MERIIMKNNYQEHLVGVIGDPVDTNPTVVIQQAAFNEHRLPYRYLTIQVREKDLEAAMNGLRAMNFTGINITMPHKLKVLQYLDDVTDSAKLIGAVNTVYWQGSKLCGDNTDGKGLIQSLRDNEIIIEGKNAVILGAGGAARAIAVELANENIKNIIICNTNRHRGEDLVNLLNNNTLTNAKYFFWNEKYSLPSDTDILINATSVGFVDPTQYPNINYDSIFPNMIVCDVIPDSTSTIFLDKAASRGCTVLNGLEMLVNQGALAYELWTGKPAPVNVMFKALLQEYEN